MIKNLLLLFILSRLFSCTQSSEPTQTQKESLSIDKTSNESKEIGVLEYEDKDYSLRIEIDKFDRSFIFGNAILLNKTGVDKVFVPSTFSCENNGIKGAINLNLKDGLQIEDRDNMTKEEIRDYFSKNYSKLMPLQKIEFKPNEEKSFHGKINFSRPIEDPKQTIIKKNSPSEK